MSAPKPTSPLKFKQTSFTRSVRILAEVEKIWILYDLDDNGSLDY